MRVSCIMPTRGRVAMAHNALLYWLAQTWPDRELVIVDDADDPSFPGGCSHVLGVKYIQQPERLTIGAKRNIACELASGDIICHWDDDDYSGPNRIADQACRLVASGLAMTGYHGMVFQQHGDRARAYKYRGGAVLGASMCYLRAWWQANRFPDKQIGEDAELIGVAERAGQISYVDAGANMVSLIHDRHTTARNIVVDGHNWRDCQPVPLRSAA